MDEPRSEPKLTPKPVGPHTETDKLKGLLKADIWFRQGHERGQRLTEQTRDALVAVQDEQGRNLQFLVQVARNLDNGGINVNIVPTGGTVRKHPDLQTIAFKSMGAGDDAIREALWGAVQNMELQNYRVDDALINIFDAKDK